MAASVNLPASAPLPPRPSAAEVEESIAGATAMGTLYPRSAVLAAEVLHLRRALEEKGSELGSLMFQAGEVTRAWKRAYEAPTGSLAAGAELAGELDELAERVGGI